MLVENTRALDLRVDDGWWSRNHPGSVEEYIKVKWNYRIQEQAIIHDELSHNEESINNLRTGLRRNKTKHHNDIRRYRIAENGGSYTSEEWIRLLDFYCGMCVKCGSTENIHADHVCPVACGGTSYIENIQPLCCKCNLSKGTTAADYRGTVPEWFDRNRYDAGYLWDGCGYLVG